MKDLAHHLKQLNRKIIRSLHREELQQDAFDPFRREMTEKQKKKQAKAKKAKERKARTPQHLTEEERNKKMQDRVPVFDRLNHPREKHTRPTHKKTPRI